MAETHPRHVGFSNVQWAGLTLGLCRALEWDAAGQVESLWDDDYPVRLGVIPHELAGKITLQGRRLGQVLPEYWGRMSDMTARLLQAVGDGTTSIPYDTLTFRDSVLVSFNMSSGTSDIAEKTLTFEYSRSSGAKDGFKIS